MKAMVCEMCNGNNIVKQEGVYVCQNCGSKYAPEDAKKLIIEIDKPIIVDSNIESIYNSASGFINLQRWDDASKLFNKMIEQDSTDYRGWWGLFLAKTKNMTLHNRLFAIVDTSDGVSAIKIAPDNKKGDLEKTYNVYKKAIGELYTIDITRKRQYVRSIYMMEFSINGKEISSLTPGITYTIDNAPEIRYKLRFADRSRSSSVVFELHNDVSVFVYYDAMFAQIKVQVDGADIKSIE